MQLTDYLLDQSDIDWPTAFRQWSWLVPGEFTLWIVSRFADCFLILPDNSIHMLKIDGGTLTRLAGSRDEFALRIDEGNNANEWLSIPLVDELVAAGFHLQPCQCYGFKQPPVLGGRYTLDNISPIPLVEYLCFCGQIHEQLNDLPDGTRVRLEISP